MSQNAKAKSTREGTAGSDVYKTQGPPEHRVHGGRNWNKVGTAGRRCELGSEGEGVATAAPRQEAARSIGAVAGCGVAAPEDGGRRQEASQGGGAGRKPGVSLQEDGRFQGTWVSDTTKARGAGWTEVDRQRSQRRGHGNRDRPERHALRSSLRKGELHVEDWIGCAAPQIAPFSAAESMFTGTEILLRTDRQGLPMPILCVTLISQIPCAEPCPSLLQHDWPLQLAPKTPSICRSPSCPPVRPQRGPTSSRKPLPTAPANSSSSSWILC